MQRSSKISPKPQNQPSKVVGVTGRYEVRQKHPAVGSAPATVLQYCSAGELLKNPEEHQENFVTFPLFPSSVNDHKRKQKVLGPNQKLKFNPTELIIYCKDFRIVRFRFDESGPESAKKVMLLSFIKFPIPFSIQFYYFQLCESCFLRYKYFYFIYCLFMCTCGGKRPSFCSWASFCHVNPRDKTLARGLAGSSFSCRSLSWPCIHFLIAQVFLGKVIISCLFKYTESQEH